MNESSERIIADEVKLQFCSSAGAPNAHWELIGTGALVWQDLQINLKSADQNLHKLIIADSQPQALSDGVVYIRDGDGICLAYAFKDGSAAKNFFSIIDEESKCFENTDNQQHSVIIDTSQESFDFFPLQPPDSQTVGDFVVHLVNIEESLFAMLQANLTGQRDKRSILESPVVTAKRFVNSVMKQSWLDELWKLLYNDDSNATENSKLSISELLIRTSEEANNDLIKKPINLSSRIRINNPPTSDQMRNFLNFHYQLTSTDDINEPRTYLYPHIRLRREIVNEDWKSLQMLADELVLGSNLTSYLDPLCILLSNDNFQGCLTAFENLPIAPAQNVAVPHIEYWKTQMNIVGEEVLGNCISCAADRELFTTTIAWLSRLAYIRDVCLPRMLEDSAINVRNQRLDPTPTQKITLLMASCHSFLCKLLRADRLCIGRIQESLGLSTHVAHFLVQMLRGMRASPSNMIERSVSLQWLINPNILIELEGYFTSECDAVRNWKSMKTAMHESRLQQKRQLKFSLFETANHFETVTPLVLATEIFHTASLSCPRNIHQAFLNSSASDPNRSPTLWLALTQVLHSSSNYSVLMQISEIFRNVLKNDVFANDVENADVLGLFFDRGILDLLIDILLRPVNANSCENISIKLFARAQILSIFCQCSKFKQPVRMTYRFVQTNLFQRLVKMCLALAEMSKSRPFGAGLKSMLIQTIKLIKTFSTDQEHSTRYGSPEDPISSLLPLLLPTDLNYLSEQAAASASEEEEEDEPLSNNSDDFFEDQKRTTTAAARILVVDSSNDLNNSSSAMGDYDQSADISEGPLASGYHHQPPANRFWVFEPSRTEGSVVEGLILDLLSSILKHSDERKSGICSLVDKNLGTFSLLDELYSANCGINLFGKLMTRAHVREAERRFAETYRSHKHSTRTRNETKSGKPTQMGSGMGLLKRGRTRRALSEDSSGRSPTPLLLSSDDEGCVFKRLKLDNPLSRSATTLFYPQIPTNSTTSFPLPPPISNPQQEEDVLEAIAAARGPPPVTVVASPKKPIRISLSTTKNQVVDQDSPA